MPRKKPTPLEVFDHVPCNSDCGQHYGIGHWNAEKRARIYAWYRYKKLALYDTPRREYLQSYEAIHGPVKPNLR